jgi:hypothetical protein
MSQMLKQRSKMVPQMDGERRLERERHRIRKAFLKSACAETAAWPEQYRRKRVESPLYLHCTAVATVIQALFSGDIVTGKIKGITHYWNRLPDGKEVDFTSCQFGGDGFTPLKKGRKVRERTGLTPLRFLLFAKKVMEQL